MTPKIEHTRKLQKVDRCSEMTDVRPEFLNVSILSKHTAVAIETITMKSFQLVTLFALIAASMAFSPNQVPSSE
jgi:hypothetical protein